MLPWNTGAVVAIAPPVRCSTFPFQPKQFPPPPPKKKKKKKKNQNSPSRVTLEDILYNQLLLLFFGLYFILYYP